MLAVSKLKMLIGLGQPPQLPRLGRLPSALLLLACVGLSVTVLGEFSRAFAYLCLLTTLPVTGAGLVAAAIAVYALGRRAYATAGRSLVAAALGFSSYLLSAVVILGTPVWVKRQARPAIEAVVQYAGNGPYPSNDSVPLPSELQRVMRSAGCFYSERDGARNFHLTCHGVLFTKCTYDHRTGTWSAWD